MKNIRVEYTGQKLKDTEWLLKVRKDKMGFLSKLTQKGKLHVAFDEWHNGGWHPQPGDEIPVVVINEKFKSGWELNSGSRYDMYRLGKSQSWVKVKHPMGFILEIHLENFFNIVVPYLSEGKMVGEYKWVGNKLERK